MALTQSDIDDVEASIKAVVAWAEGGPAFTATMPNGRTVPSPSKVIADSLLFKDAIAWPPGGTVTDATQTYTDSGIVYAPQPSLLPFSGSGAFPSASMYVVQGILSAALADQTTTGSQFVGFYDFTLEEFLNNSQFKADNLAAAILLDFTSYDRVETASYYSGWAATTDGPKGGTVYHDDGTTGTASTIYADKSGFYDSTGKGFRISSRHVSPEIFAARGDGITDDVTSWNDALSYLASIGGGTLTGGYGVVYKIDSAITGLINAAGSNLEGITINGNWCQLDGDGFNGLVLQIGRDSGGETLSSRVERIVVEKLRISGSGDSSSDTSQSALKILSALGVVIRDVYIDNIGGDALICDKPALALDGKAFNNGIVLDSVRVRFSGRRSLVVGEGVVTDDITIIGNCMFNNGGSSLTSDAAGDVGGVHIETQTLMWYGGEVSGFGNDAGTFGYPNTVYLRSCAGFMSGVHFELNGVRASNGFYDLFLDTDCHGMVVTGLEFNESISTNVQFGIKSTSIGATISGMQFVGSRVPEILVQINNSNDTTVNGIYSSVAPATARINVNDAAKTALIHDDGYVTLPENNASQTGGNVGSFTWSSATSSFVVANDTMTAVTNIVCFPKNASAGTLMGSTKCPYVSARVVGTSFTLTTADGTNAASGEEFYYIIFN